jgi:hypothetical protein
LAIVTGTDAALRLAREPGGMRKLDADLVQEFWRLQLLDELRRKRAALDYEPQLDPEGRRRDGLDELIVVFEDRELEALRGRRD